MRVHRSMLNVYICQSEESTIVFSMEIFLKCVEKTEYMSRQEDERQHGTQ